MISISKSNSKFQISISASNIVEVSARESYYALEPVMGAKVNGSQSMPGTWTMPDGSAIVANTVSIRLYQQTAGSNTFTEIIPPAPVFVSATTWILHPGYSDKTTRLCSLRSIR